jgi:hypothetical protein
MSDVNKCCKLVNTNYGPYPCNKIAKVEREGESYCSKHDPEKKNEGKGGKTT